MCRCVSFDFPKNMEYNACVFRVISSKKVRFVMKNATKMEKLLNTAFASARMEGFEITPHIEHTCKMILSGEISLQDYLRQVANKRPA